MRYKVENIKNVLQCATLCLLLMGIVACQSKPATSKAKSALVFQTDFGLKDGAVSAMKGVAIGVHPDLKLYDLTHEIPAYNIWEAAYRLQQTAPYWPAGTVFVSVVDPGVGTNRKSVVAKARNGQYFVTPDNGTLTLISESIGIQSVREINEKLNRIKDSRKSYTFHGRDVYAYTGARLAAGLISFEEVGSLLGDTVVQIPYQKPVLKDDTLMGNIPILDIQYGNVWTNINDSIFNQLRLTPNKKSKSNYLNSRAGSLQPGSTGCQYIRRGSRRPATGVYEQPDELFPCPQQAEFCRRLSYRQRARMEGKNHCGYTLPVRCKAATGKKKTSAHNDMKMASFN